MIEKIKAFILGNKKELFFVFLVFVLGFAVRGHLMIYELMFEFDSYFHARIAAYVIQHLAIPAVDPIAYFQFPEGATLPASGFFWFFTAAIYKIFTLNAPYDKNLWIVFVKFLPALFGALTSAAMYYLGKEMYSKKAGAAMAIVAATIPAFVYRTMAGFFEDDSLGFLWLIIGFVFFIRAVKNAEFNRQTIIDSALAAFFFILMGLTWQVFIMIPLIFMAWLPFTLGLMWFRKESKEKMINIAKNFAVTFVLFSVIVTAFMGTGWMETTAGYVTSYLPVTSENITRIETPGGDASSVYSISVGEEQEGFRFWGNKYSALIIFPFAALLVFVPYRLLRKKDDYISFLIFFWVLIAVFMAFIRLKFTYVLGLPLAAAVGLTLHELFEWVSGRPGFEKKTIAIIMGFFLLTGIAAGMFFVPQNVPHIENERTGWKESLYWIEANTPKDAKIFNWWDEGHWITFMAERAVSTDNRNYSLPANSAFGQMILAESEEDAYKIVDDFNADYVLISEDLVGKMGSLGIYAYNTTNYNDPRLKHYSIEMDCYRNVDTLSGSVTYSCGGNSLTEQQYLSLPYTRIGEPNQLINQNFRGFLYRNADGTKLFLMNQAANDTFITKMFFDTQNLQHFELVYSNKEVRLFKVLR